MTNKRPPAVYPDAETRAVLEALCRLETRNLINQLRQLVREAVERRGLDWDELVEKQNTPRNVA